MFFIESSSLQMATEDLLKELIGFLGPNNRSDVRAMAAKHIVEMTGGDLLNASDSVKQIWETLAVPQLVRWLGDQESISQPCRDALVNLSAHAMFSPASPCVSSKVQFWRWLIDEAKASGPLLVNLTTHTTGPGKIEEHIIGGTNRACAELLSTCSVAKDEKTKEYCLAAVRNLTVHEGARQGLAESTPSLRLLLETLALGSTFPQRRDAAGALRNLLLSKDSGVHGRVLAADGAGWLTASLILGLGTEVCPPFSELNDTLDDERQERENMSPVLAKLFRGELTKTACLDPDREARDLSVDCLLLLASLRTGREKLRETKVYPAIRAYHPHEPDSELSDKVYDLVDFLISDEAKDIVKTHEESSKKDESESEKQATESNAAWSLD